MNYSEERINESRQIELDFVKAFAIIFMVIIHVYEELSAVDVSIAPQGFLHNFLQFMAGPLAAPAFMFAMGLGTLYTKNRSPKVLIKRGIQLFITAYVLNIVRDAIPCVISSFVKNTPINIEELIYVCFNIDILAFAGLAFIAIGISKHFKVSLEMLGVLAVLFQFLGTFLSAVVPINYVTQYIFGLFFYTSDVSCFPFFQWFIYPISGMIFAKYLKHIKDLDLFYKGVLYVSLIVIAGLSISLYTYGFDLKTFYMLKDNIYYRQTFLSFLFTISCVCAEISLFHFIRKKIQSIKIENTIKFISSNLTNIYYYQWIIIGWINMFFRPSINFYLVIPVGLVIMFIAIGIAYLKTKRSTNN